MRYKLTLIALLVATSGLAPVALAERTPGAAAVASAHPLATDAGHEILARGGNAFDAAVAITAALAVVEPAGSGLGGGGFWLLRRQDGHEVMVDGRETAPAAAQESMYLDQDGNVIPRASLDGPLAAAIPGVPAGLAHIAARYGRLPLSVSLAPAIRYAEKGFKVSKHYQRLAELRQQALMTSQAATEVFLSGDEIPGEGKLLRQKDLAATLRLIAQKGHDGFYKGILARKMVEGVREAGGIWTLADLEKYRIRERKPVTGSYRGWRIVSVPPPSSGGAILVQMLNILEGYDLDRQPSWRRHHLVIEAMRQAYRDRAEYLGDSDFIKVDLEKLTSKDYAGRKRKGIRMDRATPSDALRGVVPASKGEDTTHFSVLDAQGNAVGATLSINYPFGCGFMPRGTGVILNNEMDDFVAKPGVPNVYGLVGSRANAIAPHKRPLSSMTPTFLEHDDRLVVLGTPGGSRIITMVLLAALEATHGRGQVKDWVSLPRFHHQYLPDRVVYESGAFSDSEAKSLEKLGHKLKERQSTYGERSATYGNMHAVVWDRRMGTVHAASDPRGEGKASVVKQGKSRLKE